MNIIKSNINFVESKLAYGNKPDTIALHHAEASHCSVYDVDQWHKSNGWAGIGYHYFVTKTGQVYTGRPENAIGAHCPGQNDHSIGICAEGSYMTETMPEAQKQAIVDLCKYIKGKYKITKIGGHKEFYSTDCPGTKYPLQEIKNLVAAVAAPKVTNVPAPKYDTSIPPESDLIKHFLGTFYVEKGTDGELRIHLDRANYLHLRKGQPPKVYWNDNKGNGGSKQL